MGHFSVTSQRPLSDLKEGLSHTDPIVYRENGNRANDAPALLRRLEALMPAIGVTRVGELSHLAPHAYPVYQSARPKLLLHPSIGQNSGAQGKGKTATQAKISCLMESIEGFSAEPREPRLVRGTFAYLSNHHAIIDPACILHRIKAPLATKLEPLMWTDVYHAGLEAPVLVPAESIYSYLPVKTFQTMSHFAASSNGLGGGATYLEAAVHGIYEVIERYYLAMLEGGLATIECLTEFEHKNFDLAAFKESFGGEFELQLFAVKIPSLTNLPMIVCKLANGDHAPTGFGCCGDVDTAIDRAISEALQSYATLISGAREDIDKIGKGDRIRSSKHIGVRGFDVPRQRTLWISEYREQIHSMEYATLRDEFVAAVDWLFKAGYENVFIANLTRFGVDVPVVKVVAAGLPALRECRGIWDGGWDDNLIATRQYCFQSAVNTDPGNV